MGDNETANCAWVVRASQHGCVDTCVLPCVRACGRACVRVTACDRAWTDACVRAWVRGYVRVSERAFVRVCARINAQHGETERHNNKEIDWTRSTIA